MLFLSLRVDSDDLESLFKESSMELTYMFSDHEHCLPRDDPVRQKFAHQVYQGISWGLVNDEHLFFVDFVVVL